MIYNSPLFSYTLLFIVGIVWEERVALPTTTLIITTITLLTLSFTLFFLEKKWKIAYLNRALQYTLLLLFFSLGAWNISTSPFSKSNLERGVPLKEGRAEVEVVVKERTKRGSRSSSLMVSLVESPNQIQLYCREEGILERLKLGDCFVLNANLSAVEIRGGEFDYYYRYLKGRRCHFYAFIEENNIGEVKSGGKGIRALFYPLKELFIEELFKLSNGEEWGPLFIAVISGERNFLSQERVESFKQAGTLHLMAVSGLHVGFIFLFITRVLSLLGGARGSRVIRGVLSLTIIWLYALFCGLSPSTLRASIMITLYLLSTFLWGRHQLLTLLSGSALLTLLFNPHLLWDIGFQLSYLSMLSIIYIAPTLKSHFAPMERGPLSRYCITLITLSLACQLGTSPLSLHLFGSFPTYFLIGNLLMVPLAAVVVNLGALLLLSSFTLWTKKLLLPKLITLLKFSIELLFKIGERIESLPFAKVELKLLPKQSEAIMWILYALIITVPLFKRKSETKLLFL